MLHVITGQSASGKSEYAEQLVCQGAGERIYVAAMYPWDQESRERIKRHQRMREGKGFVTIESYVNLKSVQVPKNCWVLVECLSNLVANELYMDGGAKEKTVEAILEGVESLMEQAEAVFLVTNEVFSDGIEYEEETKEYLSILGELNQQVCKRAERVTEVVCGIPLYWKGEVK